MASSPVFHRLQSVRAFDRFNLYDGPLGVPGNYVPPEVTGDPTIGLVLSCTRGIWLNSPASFTYEWKRAGVTIAGATLATYTLIIADLANAISCVVTATNAQGSVSVSSNALVAISI